MPTSTPQPTILVKKADGMTARGNNYAFIDAQNLHISIEVLGWHIDYARFRVYLKDKYRIQKAFMFMGFLPELQQLYAFLRQSGFVLIFKEIQQLADGGVKGNCDAELVLQTVIELPNYNQALLITGDGDFVCLIKYLKEQNRLLRVIAPSPDNCARSVRQAAGKNFSFFTDLRHKLAYTKKPYKDGTL